MARAQSSLAASAALCSRAMMPFPASSAGTLLSCSGRSWQARLGANATAEAGGSRCWTPIAFPYVSDAAVYNEGNARQFFGSMKTDLVKHGKVECRQRTKYAYAE